MSARQKGCEFAFCCRPVRTQTPLPYKPIRYKPPIHCTFVFNGAGSHWKPQLSSIRKETYIKILGTFPNLHIWAVRPLKLLNMCRLLVRARGRREAGPSNVTIDAFLAPLVKIYIIMDERVLQWETEEHSYLAVPSPPPRFGNAGDLI